MILTIEESMAVAVLQGDKVAALALADCLLERETSFALEVAKTRTNRNAITVMTREVWRWPEFIALCDRLGIYRDGRTTGLTIELKANDVINVTQHYMAGETGGGGEAT